MPMAISFVGASVIWKFVYEYRGAGNDQIGILNAIIVAIGSYHFYFKNLNIAWLALFFFLAIATSGEILLSGLCN